MVAPWPPPCLLGQCGACPSRVLTDLRLRCGPAGPIIRRRLSCVPCPGRFAVLFQVLPTEALGALLPFKFKFGPILTLSPTCVEVLSSRPSAVLGVGAPPPPTSPDKTKHTDRRELWQVQRNSAHRKLKYRHTGLPVLYLVPVKRGMFLQFLHFFVCTSNDQVLTV